MLETLFLTSPGVHFLTFCRCKSSSTSADDGRTTSTPAGGRLVLFPRMAEALALTGAFFLNFACLRCPRSFGIEILSRADSAKFLSFVDFLYTRSKRVIEI